jgi:DNA-binding transcriptional ArsR family regulator
MVNCMTVDRIFEALSSSARRQILAFLSAGELSAGQIAERFSMSAPAISRHLSLLEVAGLVLRERRGQYVVYRLNRDNLVNTLTGFAFEVCPTAGPLKREARKLAKRKPARS